MRCGQSSRARRPARHAKRSNEEIADAEEMVAHYQHKVDVPHYGGSEDMPTRREKLARELERVAALQLELAEEMARAETK